FIDHILAWGRILPNTKRQREPRRSRRQRAYKADGFERDGPSDIGRYLWPLDRLMLEHDLSERRWSVPDSVWVWRRFRGYAVDRSPNHADEFHYPCRGHRQRGGKRDQLLHRRGNGWNFGRHRHRADRG